MGCPSALLELEVLPELATLFCPQIGESSEKNTTQLPLPVRNFAPNDAATPLRKVSFIVRLSVCEEVGEVAALLSGDLSDARRARSE